MSRLRSAAPALRLVAVAVVLLGGATATAHPAHAQRQRQEPAETGGARFTGTLDAGAASVQYDEYLRTDALVLAPAGRLDMPRGSVAARGALSRFAGGNRSLQGVLAGSFLQSLAHGLVGELGALGSSTYYSGAESPEELGGDRAGSLVGELRVHRIAARRGAWLGVTTGVVTDGYDRRALVQPELAAWTSWRGTSLAAIARPTALQGARYLDGELHARWWWRGRLEVGGQLGGRLAGQRAPVDADGERAARLQRWGEASVSLWATPRAALVLGAGRYPADLLQGVPGARFATAALRIATRVPPRLESASRADRAARPTPLALLRALPAGDFAVRTRADGRVTLRVRAPEALRVDLMGDFTDWEPLALARGADGTWERTFRLAPGTYRFNVRRDGGAWEVPSGATPIADDLGGEAGLLVIG